MATTERASDVRPAELSPLPPPPQSVSWLLSQASHALATRLTAGLEALDLSPRGHCVLSLAASGEFTQGQIAQAIGLDKTTMVVTIDELERAGLAERRPSSADRRARVIAVTEAGERLVDEGERIVTCIEDQVLSALPPSQREAFATALARLVDEELAVPVACTRPVRRRRPHA